MSRGLLRGVFVLGLCLLATSAGAQSTYQYLEHQVLNNSQDPFKYYVDGRATKPAGIDLTLVETAVQGAFKTWEDVDCAWPAFQYANPGRATSSNVPDLTDLYDSYNVTAIWVTSKDALYYKTVNRDDHLAVPLTYGGIVFQCDIYLNAVDFRWSTLATTPQGYLDLQTRMTQAIGTCLGLDKVYDIDLNSVMFSVPEPGVSRRQLSDYDRGALCQKYPQTGAVGSPCNNASCGGSAPLCASTQSPANGAAISICTKTCTGSTGGECPTAYECRDYGSGKACLPPAASTVTKVGLACDGGTDCGGAFGRCLEEATLPSGGPAWKDGYCSRSCASNAECPTGSQCIAAGTLGQICLKKCEPGAGDCRDGYACSSLPEGSLCVPGCYNNVDCGSDSACQVCDRTCVARQTAGRAVGDPCSTDSECGQAQTCLKLNGNTQGVCAQPCDLAACSCSAGTTCRQAGSAGERYCLKDCAQGTCASPLQCTNLKDGTACLAACTSNAQCPPGLQCGGGYCKDPNAGKDAGTGTCTLCSDGGTQPPPPPVDAGTGTGGTSGPDGCGCHSAPTSAAFLLGLGVLLLAMRRRTWPRP